MKIKFETTDENECLTDCPYGYINGYEGTTKKVGTYPCRYCMNFVGIDTKNKEVECKYKETFKRNTNNDQVLS